MEFTPILYLVILVLSIILHEVAHGYAANALGDPTARLAGRLTMNPIPHIDPVGSLLIPATLVLTGSPLLFGWARPVPYNPYNLRNYRFAEAAVAVAGSAANLLLALVFGLIVRFGTGLPEATLAFASAIAFTNLFLGFFNLIPFPPLDGYTVLRAVLPWRLAAGFQQFEHRVHAAGIFSLILFLLIFSWVFADLFFSLVLQLFRFIVG